MRTILLYITILCTTVAMAQCPLVQTNISENGYHYKDLNTQKIDDGSNDIIVAGTRFNSGFTNEKLQLTRVNTDTGAVVWENHYDNYPITRGFDITQFSENGSILIAATGFAGDGANFNEAYIVVIDASTGAVIRDKSYSFNNVTHAQGLHIINTNSNVGGVSTPGFVVAGYYTEEYRIDFMNINNGFIMRTDINLNELWTTSTNSSTSVSIDYDMLNHVTETNGGFFVTGASNDPIGSQQGVAMMKFDFDGNLLWEQNYIQGNNRDVAVDALYDSSTNWIYVLVYYSQTHNFGITTIDNTTGNIELNRSWFATENDLNWTGFSLEFSNDPSASEDLVVFGYKRDADVLDPNGVTVQANTVPFAISFNKFTGSVSRANLYPVPYADPAGYNDYFRYWDGQSPLIFHPDISTALYGNNCYAMVSNRSYNQSTTAIEFIRIDNNLLGSCNNEPFSINQFPITPTYIDVITQVETATQTTLNLVAVSSAGLNGNCEDGGVLGTSGATFPQIHIYPNPTSEILNISNIVNNYGIYTVYDVQGKVLIYGSIIENNVDVSQLVTGVYFIKISEETRSTTLQFIKD